MCICVYIMIIKNSTGVQLGLMVNAVKQETVQLVVVLIRMMKHPKLVCMQFLSYHDIMCESIRHSCRSFSWTSGSTCIGCWNNNHFYHYVHKVMITLSHTYHTYFIFTDITQRNVNLMTLNK